MNQKREFTAGIRRRLRRISGAIFSAASRQSQNQDNHHLNKRVGWPGVLFRTQDGIRRRGLRVGPRSSKSVAARWRSWAFPWWRHRAIGSCTATAVAAAAAALVALVARSNPEERLSQAKGQCQGYKHILRDLHQRGIAKLLSSCAEGFAPGGRTYRGLPSSLSCPLFSPSCIRHQLRCCSCWYPYGWMQEDVGGVDESLLKHSDYRLVFWRSCVVASRLLGRFVAKGIVGGGMSCGLCGFWDFWFRRSRRGGLEMQLLWI